MQCFFGPFHSNIGYFAVRCFALTNLLLGFVFLTTVCVFSATNSLPKSEQFRVGAAEKLVAAYPDFLVRSEGAVIFWKDGSSMDMGHIEEGRTFLERLNAPSLVDQFVDAYSPGGLEKHPKENFDPGRIRFEPFFLKMYGNCRKGDVAHNLRDVVWLPNKYGRVLKVTAINGVAEKLSQISEELDQLPSRFDKYLMPVAGTYNCRSIAGTKRLSVHAYGAAIDLNVRYADYWRWSKPNSDGKYVYRNRIPMEIVEIFERHGFIWGGKWYHFDSMHFEYRPELLIPD